MAGSEPEPDSAVRGVEADFRRSWIFSLYASLSDETEEWPSLYRVLSVRRPQFDYNSPQLKQKMPLTLWPFVRAFPYISLLIVESDPDESLRIGHRGPEPIVSVDTGGVGYEFSRCGERVL